MTGHAGAAPDSRPLDLRGRRRYSMGHQRLPLSTAPMNIKAFARRKDDEAPPQEGAGPSDGTLAALAPPATEAPAAGNTGALVAIDANPIPEGGVSGYFDGQDLTRLRFARWEATVSPVLGTVCLFTGRAEFIEKYFETVGDLRRRGFHVAVMDWRGQGGSARMLRNTLKGDVTTFDQYLADLDHFMRDIVLPDCPGPYFVLAHSMGANILMQALSRRAHWFDRAVMVSPMLDIVGLRFSMITMRRLAEIACYAGFGAAYVPGGPAEARRMTVFEGNPCTSDRRRFERNLAVTGAAPELALGAPTIGWFHAAARAMEVVTDPEFTARLRAPVLLIGAGLDRVVSTPAIEAVGLGLRGGGFLVIDGARHEILQERDWLREQFWAAFDAFVPGG